MAARITVTGNAVTAPLVRVTKTGRRVANFRIGSTERYQDKSSGDWVDGNTFFVGVACWGALADNIEASVTLGMPLVVTGKISQRSYLDANDKPQFAYEIQAETVAPDLNRGTVEFTKVSRTNGRSVALDADGQPPVAVAEDPFERVGALATRRDDSLSINPDGTFGAGRGHDDELEPDDRFAESERDVEELVGAGH
ncbi:single-stranded DNA-binding protein [Jatrophihabitans sp. YIM 134969]